MKFSKILLFKKNRLFATSISKKELQEAIKNKSAKIIDVREIDEYNQGFVPTAENIPISKIIENNQILEKLANNYKHKDVIFYCRAGVRSAKVCKVAEDLGFKRYNFSNNRVYNFKDGYIRWSKDD